MWQHRLAAVAAAVVVVAGAAAAKPVPAESTKRAQQPHVGAQERSWVRP